MSYNLWSLVLTDSLHAPSILGFFNTHDGGVDAGEAVERYLTHQLNRSDNFSNFSGTTMRILDECAAAIEKNPAHYVATNLCPVESLSTPESNPFTIYYTTEVGNRYFTTLKALVKVDAGIIVMKTVPHCKILTTAPDDPVESASYTEIKPEMLDSLAIHQPKSTKRALFEFAKLVQNGAITRGQFETFVHSVVNNPLPNESIDDLKETVSDLRRCLNYNIEILIDDK
jgi:hypothetical protein